VNAVPAGELLVNLQLTLFIAREGRSDASDGRLTFTKVTGR
jgi:hypothetical protein